MVIEVFSLCDAATYSGGKLNILGAFDSIKTKGLPFSLPRFTVAVRLRFLQSADATLLGEGTNYDLDIELMEHNGSTNCLSRMGTKFDIRFRHGRETRIKNVVFNFDYVTFERDGAYSLDLILNGTRKRRLPLQVRKLN